MGMTFKDVDAFAMNLPGVTVGARWANRTWMVDGKGFAWQRPFSKADLKRFGDETPPAGEILAVSVENLDAKDALLAMAPPGVFQRLRRGPDRVAAGAHEGRACRDPRRISHRRIVAARHEARRYRRAQATRRSGSTRTRDEALTTIDGVTSLAVDRHAAIAQTRARSCG
jgi:hypothetical protein